LVKLLAGAVSKENITASGVLRGPSKIKSQEHTNRRYINMTNNYEGKMLMKMFH
jgi:hypothetical protein